MTQCHNLRTTKPKQLTGTGGTGFLLKDWNLFPFPTGGELDSAAIPVEVDGAAGPAATAAEAADSPGNLTCFSRLTALWSFSSRKVSPSKNKTASFSL